MTDNEPDHLKIVPDNLSPPEFTVFKIEVLVKFATQLNVTLLDANGVIQTDYVSYLQYYIISSNPINTVLMVCLKT